MHKYSYKYAIKLHDKQIYDKKQRGELPLIEAGSSRTTLSGAQTSDSRNSFLQKVDVVK